MNSSGADEPRQLGWGLEELQILTALGFGPDSALMNEPKLLVDAPFLAALLNELRSELGPEEAGRTLFHIGLIHGLRDAVRIGDAEPGADGRIEMIEYAPLAMRFGPRLRPPGADDDGFMLQGSWPDHFEAEAHLSKLGAAVQPVCALSAGYTSGWLSGTLDRDVVAEEISCRAAGHTDCCFLVRDEQQSDCANSEAAALPRLSVSALRAVAHANPADPTRVPIDSSSSRVDAVPTHADPKDPAVHIWGPVMVMPFTGPEVAMQTVDMLARDEAARMVRVVVFDLCGAVVDESFGAAALESVIEEVQGWGAEVILTGMSPLSEDAVAELQASLLLSRKELPEAIAYAFQIADAQRHLL